MSRALNPDPQLVRTITNPAPKDLAIHDLETVSGISPGYGRDCPPDAG